MKIRYEVYLRNYESKKADEIGFFIDFWKEIDFTRGRSIARKYFGTLVRDPNAIFVLGRKEKT